MVQIESIPPDSDYLHFIVTAIDDTGNTGKLEKTRKILDTMPPEIYVDFDTPRTSYVFHVKVTGVDNREIDHIDLNYTINGGILKTAPDEDGDYAIEIPPQARLLTLFCSASDKSGNSATETIELGVGDGTPPEISKTAVQISGKRVFFYLECEDNREIRDVYIILREKNG
jgi:hypothetical protein